MKSQLSYYDVFPKIALTGKSTLVTIHPLDGHVAFDAQKNYEAEILPMARSGCIPSDASQTQRQFFPSITRRAHPVVALAHSGNNLTFTYTFPEEQEYRVLLRAQGGDTIECFCLYALREDFYALRPFKGSMHCHSCRSDGVEAPATVAANYRAAGYDFIALTDHFLYAPSVEMCDAYKDIPIDMKLFHGEEVHVAGSNIHILNFGGDASVNEACRNDLDAYCAAVWQLRETLDIADEQDAWEYAASLWAFQKIREFGGLAILAHPNWIWQDTYNVPVSLTFRFLREHPFDALEIVNGGDGSYENEQQVAIWQQVRAEGTFVPVVGTDDSHGTVNGQWFNIGKTYVLSPSCAQEDLAASIRAGRCTAALQYHGESTRFYGEYRIVSLAQYLDSEYFPLHDALCAEEGRLMLQAVDGSAEAIRRLAACQGQTAHLMTHFWG